MADYNSTDKIKEKNNFKRHFYMTLFGFLSGILVWPFVVYVVKFKSNGVDSDLIAFEPGLLFGIFIAIYFLWTGLQHKQANKRERVMDVLFWIFFSTLAYVSSFAAAIPLLGNYIYLSGAVGATILYLSFNHFLYPLKKNSYPIVLSLGIVLPLIFWFLFEFLVVMAGHQKQDVFNHLYMWPLFVMWNTIMALVFSLRMEDKEKSSIINPNRFSAISIFGILIIFSSYIFLSDPMLESKCDSIHFVCSEVSVTNHEAQQSFYEIGILINPVKDGVEIRPGHLKGRGHMKLENKTIEDCTVSDVVHIEDKNYQYISCLINPKDYRINMDASIFVTPSGELSDHIRFQVPELSATLAMGNFSQNKQLIQLISQQKYSYGNDWEVVDCDKDLKTFKAQQGKYNYSFWAPVSRDAISTINDLEREYIIAKNPKFAVYTIGGNQNPKEKLYKIMQNFDSCGTIIYDSINDYPMASFECKNDGIGWVNYFFNTGEYLHHIYYEDSKDNITKCYENVISTFEFKNIQPIISEMSL